MEALFDIHQSKYWVDITDEQPTYFHTQLAMQLPFDTFLWFSPRPPSTLPKFLTIKTHDTIFDIITDLTSEISEVHNATYSIKFKWKYRTSRFRHHIKSELNTFDDTYSREYD